MLSGPRIPVFFGRKESRFPDDWHDYLVGISAAIEEGDEEGVLRAFQAVN
jgi:hypothetical protein